MTIEVNEWYDDSGKLNLTITWDENDPKESKFNNWTSSDFSNFLTTFCNACNEELSMGGETCTFEDLGMCPPHDA
jgi:hypothetical protein